MNSKFKKSIIAVSLTLAMPLANAAENTNDDELEHITIISHYDKLRTEAGSATLLTEAELEKFEYDDIHRILSSVPGINIREEDGYGLRPNIGFRGVTPERSKKITIMEDGVLIGPAPYSAPAAYYFPVTTRMTAVEVFKGPAVIKHGPQTVAGALNLVTRQVPEFSEGGIDLATGSDGYQKAHAYFGSVLNNVGFLLEGVSLKADGFKELDNGDDTGFKKNDLLAKFNYQVTSGDIEHEFGLKLSYSDEKSDETYLGLSDKDFSNTPFKRYAASQEALMDTQHSQVMFSHGMLVDDLSVTTRVYRNNFERAWKKVGGFVNDSKTLNEVLSNPNDNLRYYNVLTGIDDSVIDGTNPLYLDVGTNDREYFSQGIQLDATYEYTLYDLDNTLDAGIRFHQDEIERKHFTEVYGISSADMQKIGDGVTPTRRDTESTDAWSVYFENQVSFDALTLGLGVRGEFMDMHYQNNVEGKENDWQDKTTRIWLPSLSGFYKLSDKSGLLFGVHRGFSPLSPKQPANKELERSTNYEFGGRFNDGVTQFEVVSFFNDYSNLTETCGQSNAGECGDGVTFSGGEVDVYGLEAQFSQSYPLNLQIDIPYSFVYTYTKSEFKNDFNSKFVQWGDVKAGDALPYLAEHQATMNVGLSSEQWNMNLSVKYVGEMPEVAGEGETLSGSFVPAHSTVDFSASYLFDKYGKVYFKVDNLLDDVKVASRRPYGARPTKPRQVVLGYKYQF